MRPNCLNWAELGAGARRDTLRRPRAESENIRDGVGDIIRQVREGGDEALLALTAKFDGCQPSPLAIDAAAQAVARSDVAAPLMAAIEDAEQRIRTFHSAALPQSVQVETAPGMRCEARYQAVDRVGLYVPGGSAALVSTVLMLAVPASLAGCRRVVLCTPPGADGSVSAEVLATASMCGVDLVCAIGGAQAIAAMAYGTQSVPRCDKLFGPGNAWVTEAKLQVSLDPDGAAIDMPAGPSEVFVIADDAADATAVAWDLLSQAEHGPDSQVILATDSAAFAEAVADTLQRLAAGLPRTEILQGSLSAARILITRDLAQAIEIANHYAPEHLIVNTRNPRDIADRAQNAGSIFIGPWTPESLGDYCSGTNHVLPTNGWARSYGGLSVFDFMRRYTLQEASREALERLGPTAEALAEFEGLEAHRMAVRHRLDTMSPS